MVAFDGHRKEKIEDYSDLLKTAMEGNNEETRNKVLKVMSDLIDSPVGDRENIGVVSIALLMLVLMALHTPGSKRSERHSTMLATIIKDISKCLESAE